VHHSAGLQNSTYAKVFLRCRADIQPRLGPCVGFSSSIVPEHPGKVINLPYYKGVIDELTRAGHERHAQDVADLLLRLRTRLRKALPERNVDRSILLATWNLREFGRNEKFGKRLPESLLYIAEIISKFDIVAIQEVNENLHDLHSLMELLGRWWDYIVTDVTPGPSGNRERITFVFDSRKVRFDHLAGELSLAPTKKGTRQPARSPFVCAFRTGWRRIAICSVHIYYGTAKPNDPLRVKEIDAIAGLLAQRNDHRRQTPDGEPDSVILLGDFNIFNKTGDKTSQALEDHNFRVPQIMRTLPASNLGGDKHFDQIAFHDPDERLKSSRAGIFDFSTLLFPVGDAEANDSAMIRSAGEKYSACKDRDKFYENWRTFQISDHLPLWLELRTDFSEAFLAKARRGQSTRRDAGKKERKTAAKTAIV
jgi:endonuclease/exonuclease/phosphatase family metal-dependent hydrolase